MSSVSGYLGLIPPANSGKPDFEAAITAAIEDLVADANAAASLPTLFDLDVAVGSQLDVVGKWVGLMRRVPVPITGAYFSLDIAGLGLDEGYLLGPADSVSGITSLDDSTYRIMLRIKIAANHWDGSLAGAQSILRSVVASNTNTLLMVVDNFDMTMTVGIAGTVPGAIFISLLKNYLTLIPAAVGLKELIVTSVTGSPLFGLDCENSYISGLDVGALGVIY